MASTIVVPTRPDVGAYSDAVNTAMVTEKGNYDGRVADAVCDGFAAAVTDIEALQAGTAITGVNGVSMPAGGALTTATVLRATGASTAAYGALNLAAAAAVTGILPAGNFADAVAGAAGGVRLAGDLAGTGSAAATPRVGAINSATVPAGGALTTGNVLQVTGASALGYAAVNLAGGANFVTGLLPGANQALAVSGVSQGAVTGAQAAAIDASLPVSKKTVTIGHADLTDADGSQTINIDTALPANSRIVGIDMHTYTPFTGGGAGVVTVDIGTAGDVDAIIDGADLFAAAVDGGLATIPKGIRPNKFFAAGGQLTAQVDANVNVADLTAGAVTIDVMYTVLA